MALSPLDQFRAAVLDDAVLQQDLRQCDGRAAFVARVIEQARERGLSLEFSDIEAALDASGRAWTLSWMQR